jgi:hypothetical protein
MGHSLMTYPHDTLIRAWLDGKTLQYLDGEVWVDCEHVTVASKVPHCYRDGTEYRIRPRIVRYRVWHHPATNQFKVATGMIEETVANKMGAVWLGEWCEEVME